MDDFCSAYPQRYSSEDQTVKHKTLQAQKVTLMIHENKFYYNQIR